MHIFMQVLCKYFCDVKSQLNRAASYSQAATTGTHRFVAGKPMYAVRHIPAIGARAELFLCNFTWGISGKRQGADGPFIET
jgi:hypothetical protein